MKKINIFIGILIGIIVITMGWVIFSGKIGPSTSEKKTETPQENIEGEVILVIDNGEGSPESFQGDFWEGMTAFDLLKEKTDELDLALKTKTYEIGILIEAIGDKENGGDGKYWLYYVNGEMPAVAADKKELKSGDKVEFKFEKSPF